mgnify:CR=1 FL=1
MIRPAITEPRPWRFPNPARSSLGSGLGLAFIDLPGQALASVELVLPTPLEAEPRELEGVATVVLHACDEATALTDYAPLTAVLTQAAPLLRKAVGAVSEA